MEVSVPAYKKVRSRQQCGCAYITRSICAEQLLCRGGGQKVDSTQFQCDKLFLTGQSNEIFDLQFFFHHSNQPGPLTNGLKDFRILVSKKTDSPQYDTAGSQKFFVPELLAKIQNVAFLSRIRIHISFCDTVPLKACVKVLRNGWTQRSIILRGD